MSSEELEKELSAQLAALETAQSKDVEALKDKIAALDRLMCEKFRSEEVARTLLASKNEAHFLELNHAKATAKDMEMKYVEKSGYLPKIDDIEKQLKSLNLVVAAEGGRRSFSNLVALAALIMALLPFLMELLK